MPYLRCLASLRSTSIGLAASTTASRRLTRRTSSGTSSYQRHLFFSQPFLSNIVGHLGGAKSEYVRQRQASLFAHVDPDFGQAIADGIGVSVVPLEFSNDKPTWEGTTIDTSNSTLDY